jgi:hypothetical protein
VPDGSAGDIRQLLQISTGRHDQESASFLSEVLGQVGARRHTRMNTEVSKLPEKGCLRQQFVGRSSPDCLAHPVRQLLLNRCRGVLVHRIIELAADPADPLPQRVPGTFTQGAKERRARDVETTAICLQGLLGDLTSLTCEL